MITKQIMGEIGATLQCANFSKLAVRVLLGYFKRIERNSGARAIVTLLKEHYIKLILLHSSHTTAELRQLNQRRKIWPGPMHPIFRMSLFSDRHFDMACAILKVTGYFVSPDATDQDYARLNSEMGMAFDEIENPKAVPKDKLEDNSPSTEMQRQARSLEYQYQMDYPQSEKKTLMDSDGNMLPVITLLRPDYISSLNAFPRFTLRYYEWIKERIFGEIEGCIPFPPKEVYITKARNQRVDYAGRVTLLTKDRAMKLRSVANCSIILQTAVYPLHHLLKEVLKKTPGCYCFDQDAGVTWVAQELRRGRTLTSLDLESASNNIPLSSQVAFLRNLLPHTTDSDTLISMWVDINRMTWFAGNTTVSWKRGTAMGVGGSYYCFTAWIISRFQRLGMSGQYAVVGDDIVFNSDYEPLVLSFFEGENVPISRSKSLFQNVKFAEFCGRLITRDGPANFTKARSLDVDIDAYSKVKMFGYRALKRFRRLRKLPQQERNSIKKYYHLDKQIVDPNLAVSLTRVDELIPSANFGGYSLIQLYKLGKITLYQLSGLNAIQPFYEKYPDPTAATLLLFCFNKTEFVHEYKDKNGRVRTKKEMIRNGTLLKDFMPLSMALRSFFGVVPDFTNPTQVGLAPKFEKRVSNPFLKNLIKDPLTYLVQDAVRFQGSDMQAFLLQTNLASIVTRAQQLSNLASGLVDPSDFLREHLEEFLVIKRNLNKSAKPTFEIERKSLDRDWDSCSNDNEKLSVDDLQTKVDGTLDFLKAPLKGLSGKLIYLLTFLVGRRKD